MHFSPLALAALIAVNLVPLAGVAYLGWTVYEVLALYWLESGVIGLSNVLRMATAGRYAESAWSVASFFVFHYGLFWLAHGVFLEIAFVPWEPAPPVAADAPALPPDAEPQSWFDGLQPSTFFPWDLPWSPVLRWTLVGLVLSHGVSYARNWWAGGERLDKAPANLLFRPYGRVLVLQVAVFATGYGLQEVGEPLYGLISLVVMKIGLDVVAHIWEHTRARRPLP